MNATLQKALSRLKGGTHLLLRFKKEFLLLIMPPQAALILLNLLNVTKGRKSRYSFCKKNQLYFITNGTDRHYFSNLVRGSNLYGLGLQHRANLLGKSYFLDEIIDCAPEGAVVIDCGSNYGDLSNYFSQKSKKVTYHAFEPGGEEFNCLKLNLTVAKCNNSLLSEIDGDVEFFEAPETADGSIFRQNRESKRIVKKSWKLDTYIESENLHDIFLLKLEAEGAEPEVLQGAVRSLPRIRFVAADCGPERGLEQAETLSQVANLLINSGFSMISVDLENRAGAVLFKNGKYT